eukprot:SAG31_NODE_7191_length_1761_cov_2.515644_1_plen_370_part_10
MRFVVMVAVASLLCVGGGAAAQTADIGSQLRGLDVPKGLQQFLGAMVTKMQVLESQLETERADKVALQHRTRVLEEEHQEQISWLKRDRDALQNKTRVAEAELSNVLIVVAQLQKQTLANSKRLDQCEADTHPFIKEMDRRRAQTSDRCHGSEMQTVLTACCPAGDGVGHRRELQSSRGCDAFPDECPNSCATVFTEFYDGCHETLAGMPAIEQAKFDSFYIACTETAQQAAAMLDGASPAMIFHVVVVDEEAEQQAAMSNGGSGSAPSHFGDVNLPLAPAPPSSNGAVAAQEFRRVCTTANLATCVPDCNGELLILFLLCSHVVNAHTDATLDVFAAVTYGFLLSIEIDGRGTVMTCNVMDMLYAWVGQ